MRSRVMPGSSPTIDRRSPIRRLNKVDLPTLGRPTIATSGSPLFCRRFILIKWQNARNSESAIITHQESYPERTSRGVFRFSYTFAGLQLMKNVLDLLAVV